MVAPPFEFATAGQILFGASVFVKLGPPAAALGRHALVAFGAQAGEEGQQRAQPLLDILQNAGLDATLVWVQGEPGVSQVQAAVEIARQAGCDLVIGMGGGSAIDTAKAAAALLANPGDPLDYLEVVGKGLPLRSPAFPVIAIPTTAGTGAEVTKNAVLGVPEKEVKVSLRSPSMLPRLAVVDPELTVTLPPAVTASTGLDALTQLIEPFVSNRANPLTDGFCREGLPRVARYLRRAYQAGDDLEARTGMSLASLFGGLALANARLGAVHGFAGPLGGKLAAPHGAICARLLPQVMEVNLHALQSRQPGHPALSRYTEVARLLTGDPQATAWDGVQWVEQLVNDLRIPPLSAHGLSAGHFHAVVAQAARASSMQGNPITLTEDELVGILERAV